MTKIKLPPTLPPLTFKALNDLQDVERYARASVRGCTDAGYINREQAARILRTCAITSLAHQLKFYRALPNYHISWVGELKEKTIEEIDQARRRSPSG